MPVRHLSLASVGGALALAYLTLSSIQAAYAPPVQVAKFGVHRPVVMRLDLIQPAEAGQATPPSPYAQGKDAAKLRREVVTNTWLSCQTIQRNVPMLHIKRTSARGLTGGYTHGQRVLLTAVQRSGDYYRDARNLHFDYDVNLQAAVVADVACRAYL